MSPDGECGRVSAVACEGRVVDAGGAPVPHALVVVSGGSVPVPELALQAGPDGAFRLRLPAGRFTLRASAGERAGEAEVDTTSDGATVVLVVA
ncbi:carboxypeptidase-like regulatory domain-containing protein [Thalassiella azotivora]